MNKLMRIIAFLLSAILAFAVFTGCGGGQNGNTQSQSSASDTAESAGSGDSAETVVQSSAAGTWPIVEDGSVTLRYWAPWVGNAGLLMQSYDENYVYMQKETITGIKIEWLCPASGQEGEQFNLMVSSRDLPDMVQYNPYAGYSYPGGKEKAVEDGIFLRLNELCEEWAPNFMAILNNNPHMKRQVITDSGLIAGMGMLEVDPQTNYYGNVVRRDWMTELNLEYPETVQDWYELFKDVKEAKNTKSTYFLDTNGLSLPFLWAFDAHESGWLQRNDKVVYSFIDDGYKAYLQEMNKWWKEGLVYEDYTAGDKNYGLTNGEVFSHWTGFWVFTINDNMVHEVDPNYEEYPVAIPVLEKGGTTKLRILESNYRGFDTVITTASKYAAEGIRWLDWNYTDDGYYMNNFGQLDHTYKMIDGEPVFTEFMTNNPDGFDLNQLMNKWATQSGSFVRDWACYFVAYSDAANLTLTLWDGDSSHLLPQHSLTPTSEEGDKYSKIMADVHVYTAEQRVKFIKGETSFDEWDNYVSTIKNMNIDEAISIMQAQYDRFLVRK